MLIHSVHHIAHISLNRVIRDDAIAESKRNVAIATFMNKNSALGGSNDA